MSNLHATRDTDLDNPSEGTIFRVAVTRPITDEIMVRAGDALTALAKAHRLVPAVIEPSCAFEIIGTLGTMQSTTAKVRFRPQAWIGDNAVDVDIPEGETDEWYVELGQSGNVLNWEEGTDLDWLRHDLFAPEWVQRYVGPFEIEPVIDRTSIPIPDDEDPL